MARIGEIQLGSRASSTLGEVRASVAYNLSAPPAPLSALYRPNGDWEVEPRKDQISIVARTALKLPANSSAPSDEAVELAKVQAG